MGILIVVVTLAMLLWAVWFVARALAHAVPILRRQARGGPSREERVEREIGVVLVGGAVGVLVVTALVIAALVTVREWGVLDLQARVARLEKTVRVYDDGLARLERIVDSGATAGQADAGRLAADVRREVSALRQRVAAQH